jgi:hypothetical protein
MEMQRRSLLGAAALLLACAPALAQKSDRLTLTNGDVVTGEIKEFDRGVLLYKTDSMSTVVIKWHDVVRLTSRMFQEIELDDGRRLLGRLVEPSADFMARIAGPRSTIEFPLARIVRMHPIGETFWKRVDGSMKLGASFTKASEVTQTSAAADATYRAEHYLVGFNLSAISTDQPDRNTSRADLSATYTHLLAKATFASGTLGAQHNDELGIQLRLLTLGTYGRFFVQTNRSILGAAIGLSVNEELSTTGNRRTNLEGVLAAKYDRFRLDTPKTDLKVKLQLFPSFTEQGRWRVEFELAARQEIVKDLFFDLTVYYSFDGKPEDPEAASVDYGFVTSLGWSF